MTFLTTRLHLEYPLTQPDYEKLSRLLTVYGIRGVDVQDSQLVVDYDASRIHEAEVVSAVRKVGIAVEPPQKIPEGGFDYTGEFRDYAWPIRGLSPVNAKLK